jgi:acylphosphatase
VKRARIRVAGRVQGVGFRYSAQLRARSLGVDGWVRNLPDGAVEAVFEGNDERVESMIDWCRRGPAGSAVTDVELHWEQPVGENGFRVR